MYGAMEESADQRIAEILSNRKRRKIDLNNMRASAVLMPLFYRDGDLQLLYTKRSDYVGRHKGEMSFPGGMRDPEDEDLTATALRETHEEIGLPPDQVQLLGCLDDLLTYTRFRITPYVGLVPHPYEFVVSLDEIERIVKIPVEWILNEAKLKTDRIGDPKRGWITYSFDYRGDIVWGATARITLQFLYLVYGYTVPGWDDTF